MGFVRPVTQALTRQPQSVLISRLIISWKVREFQPLKQSPFFKKGNFDISGDHQIFTFKTGSN